MDATFLKDIKLESFPENITRQVELLKSNFKYESILLEGDDHYEFPISKKIVQEITSLYHNQKLYVDVHPNLVYGEPLIFENNYEFVGVCEKNNRNYYRFTSDSEFHVCLYHNYKRGFYYGYYNDWFDKNGEDIFFNDSEDEYLRNKIFRKAYECDDMINPDISDVLVGSYDKKVIFSVHLELYGKRVGEFLRCWKIITDYPDRFAPLFKERNGKVKTKLQSKIQWLGTPTELTELIKALVEAKVVGGSTEKDIVNTLGEVLGFEINDYEGKKKNIRKRSKDLVPLINKLELRLTSWIKKKDEIF